MLAFEWAPSQRSDMIIMGTYGPIIHYISGIKGHLYICETYENLIQSKFVEYAFSESEFVMPGLPIWVTR